MKKIYFLIVLTIITTNELTGQDQDKSNNSSKLYIGLNIGPNSNSLRGASFSQQYDSNINYFAGMSFEVKITEILSILTNLNYEEKNFKYEYTATTYFPFIETRDIEDKTKFKYLNVPVLVRYYFGFENEFFLNGGIFYNHLFDVTNEAINKETGEDLSFLEFNELFKKSDYGLSFGIGFQIRLKNNKITIELRDDLGIADIGDVNIGGISPTNTNTIKLIGNWSFGL